MLENEISENKTNSTRSRFNNFVLFRGGSKIFTRGGGGRGGFVKKFPKVLTTFFRSTNLIFQALSKQSTDPVLAKISAPQAKFEKTGQKRRF